MLERGGGGHKAEGWNNQLHSLLASANSILGQLYQGTETGMFAGVSVFVVLRETKLLISVLTVFRRDGAV